ncbi:T9SS type A sorting domain-containing protein [Rufibacter roseus]|uniref:T9SS type A sorting domain-containing protein n=1 Tax=Rufibacter roseus TaxID=1567108 RepID=A0ABW2DKM0_9BACT|nr:T9SS type A sorting domain-containing protein [Rufibacter roseus]
MLTTSFRNLQKQLMLAIWLLASMGCLNNVQAQQAGSLDTSFEPIEVEDGFGKGANQEVLTITAQSDGKILIGGKFTSYNGTPRSYIARLTPEGSIDPDFNPGAGANGFVNTVIVQPDGKILVGGDFTSYNGTVRNRIARLNADGSLDTDFNPGIGADAAVRTMVLQPDGKIIIGGEFTSYNGTPRGRIARLNADGSLDTEFNPGTGADASIRAMVMQSDGKILIGGDFTSYHGTLRGRIARLNTDGSLDTGFNPGTGANGIVHAIAIHTDGKILIGGDFTFYNGLARRYLARLNLNGSLDHFIPEVNKPVNCIAVQTDSKILIGGREVFSSSNGALYSYLARLTATGSLDSSFNTRIGANGSVQAVLVQPDGKVLIAGGFTSYNNISRNYATRLLTNGSLDIDFNIGSGANSQINTVALQPDGKVLIGGDFTFFNKTALNRIARLHADGTLDTSFNPGTGANGQILTMAVQPDGKILIGGEFTTYNGKACKHIARLHADGTLDTEFNPGTGPTAPVLAISPLPNGKMYIAGSFNSFNGTTRNCIARLNSDGSLDTSFEDGSTTIIGTIYAIAVQPDGQVLIGGHVMGNFSTNNFSRGNSLLRLSADGLLDREYKVGIDGTVKALALQPDGKLLVGGGISLFDRSIILKGITRLNANGTLDTDFNSIHSTSNTALKHVLAIKLQPDGRILVGGDFSLFNGNARNHITRLNPDGSIDMGFDPGDGANGPVYGLALQPDDKVLIAGYFTSFDGVERNRIARVFAGKSSIPTGIGELKQVDNLTVYPNPASEEFLSIKYTGAKARNVDITLTDALGQWVLSKSFPVANGNIQAVLRTSQLPAGVYFLKISDSGMTIVRKVIIQK